MLKMKKGSRGATFFWEGDIPGEQTAIVAFPDVSSNKRCIWDIGWCCSDDTSIAYGTLSENPDDSKAVWMELPAGSDVCKALTAIKIQNSSKTVCRAAVRIVCF